MTTDNITSVLARRVWDSRGNPTVEVEVHLDGGASGRAIAPAGASRGTREATDLRDGGSRLKGMDVRRALSNVTERIAPSLIGMSASDQAGIDYELHALDPSPTREALGGNATVATSLAVMHAAARAKGAPTWRYIAEKFQHTPSVPLPEIQIFGGGAHAGRRVDIQDFMIMVPGAGSFSEALEITAEVYHAAGDIMSKRGQLAGVADEGGWWPNFRSNEEALDTLVQAIEVAGEKPGQRVVVSLDIAASEFGKNGTYRLALEDRVLGSAELCDLLEQWTKTYPIVSIEDPLGEDDPAGMRDFTARVGAKIQIIGDDYLVTNAGLVERAISAADCNAVLIKVNQAGSVTDAIEAAKVAKKAGWGTIVSARSGETEDLSIVDLSVGLDAGQLKVGSFSRTERMAKWNECLRIEEELGARSFVAGRALAHTWWGARSA